MKHYEGDVEDLGLTFSFDQGIDGWNTPQLGDVCYITFVTFPYTQSIDGWNTSQLGDVSYIIFATFYLNPVIDGWNTLQLGDVCYTSQLEAKGLKCRSSE